MKDKKHFLVELIVYEIINGNILPLKGDEEYAFGIKEMKESLANVYNVIHKYIRDRMEKKDPKESIIGVT